MTAIPLFSAEGDGLRSSRLIAEAMGLKAAGVKAKENCVCALCGAAIAIDEKAAPLALGSSFVDDLSLAARGSQCICGWCSQMLTADALRDTGYGEFSRAGIRPFRKWKDIAVALIEPPEPPFVMVYATSNNQHMAWRAPVNWSRELYSVRVGLRDLRIRRRVLLEAPKVCARVVSVLGFELKEGAKTLPHPFVSLSTDLKDTAHGRLLADVFASTEVRLEDRSFLLDLSLGETWALRFVLSPNAGDEPPTNDQDEE